MKLPLIDKLHLPKKLSKRNVVIIAAVTSIVIILGTSFLLLSPARNKADTVGTHTDTTATTKQSGELTPTSEDIAVSSNEPTDTGTKSTATSETKDTKSPAQTKTESNQKTTTNSPQPKSDPAVPNPYCPTPVFSVVISRQSADNFNLFVDAVAAAGDPNLKPECGGGINFSYPVVTKPSNGPFCDGAAYPYTPNTYPPVYNRWGISCSIYGNASYGDYTFGVTITGTNGYNKSATKTAYYTLHYVQQ